MGRAKGQRVIQLRLPSCLALLRPGIDQIEADPFESILSRFQRIQSFLYVMRPAHKAQRCIVECLQTQGPAVHARRCEICESRRQIGGATVRTPVTNANIVCSLIVENTKHSILVETM